MEFKPNKKDKRIPISSYVTDTGKTETYPLNSFTFQCFLNEKETPILVYTTETETPNTYITSVNSSKKKQMRVLSTAKKEGFYFYDSTLLKHQQIIHLYNSKRNLRWTFVRNTNNKVTALTMYASAKWAEREIKDMFNLRILNLKDTRRLLLDYKTPRGVLDEKNNKIIKPYHSKLNGLHYV